MVDIRYNYEFFMCNINFYFGFIVIGYFYYCRKCCMFWCSDKIFLFFWLVIFLRVFIGVVFNVNGYWFFNSSLISVGLR